MALGSSYSDYSTPSGFNAFASSLGVNPRGGNPSRPLLRRLGVGQGALALQQQAHQASLQPMRESAIMRLIQNLSPGNRQAQVDAFSRRAQEVAAQNAQQARNHLQAGGYGSGAQAGTIGSLFAGAGDATMDYDAQINSPQGEGQALAMILQAMGAAVDPQLIQMWLQGQQTGQNVDSARAQVDAADDTGLGDFLGLAGGLAGQGTFNNLFTRRSANPFARMNFSGAFAR